MRLLFVMVVMLSVAGCGQDNYMKTSGYSRSSKSIKSETPPLDKSQKQKTSLNYNTIARNDDTVDEPVSIRFDPYIFFESGSCGINQENSIKIERMASIINAFSDVMVVVRGHADNHEGSQEFCQKLSEDRAKSVQTILIMNGVESKRTLSIGYGTNEQKSSTPDNLEENHNRTVEVSLTRP